MPGRRTIVEVRAAIVDRFWCIEVLGDLIGRLSNGLPSGLHAKRDCTRLRFVAPRPEMLGGIAKVLGKPLRIDLNRFGYELHIELEGSVIEELCLDGHKLAFIFDENHSYLRGIHQSLRNAIRLIDAGVVDFVGVEGFTGSLKEIVEPLWRSRGFQSLVHVRERLRRMGIAEQKLIQGGSSFARVLVLMRPETAIYGIEDARAYEQVGREIEKWKASMRSAASTVFSEAAEEAGCTAAGNLGEYEACLEEAISPEIKRKLRSMERSEADRFIAQRVLADRPRYFVENLIRYRQETGAGNASIINAGRMDQDVVCSILRSRRISSFIRIRPSGYPAF